MPARGNGAPGKVTVEGRGTKAAKRSRATFKPLAEKYGLFKHLQPEHVLDPRDLKPGLLYAETAFAGFDRRLEVWKGVEPMLDAD